MPKSSRKRKTNYNLEDKVSNQKNGKKIKNDESEKENLAELQNNVEIIRLDNILENEEDEEDCEWEDVSDLDDRSDIVVNLYAEEFDSSDDKKDEKREQQKQVRELRESVHKITLMGLVSRVVFISRLCDEDLIQNLAFSCLPCGIFEKKFEKTGKKLRQLVGDLLDLFHVEEDESETGDVREILKECYRTKRVSKTWVNVVVAAMLRSAGIETRLVACIYPGSLKKVDVSNGGMLCPPTVHKPSTRGKSGKKAKKTVDTSTVGTTRTIIFTVEILDGSCNQWVPWDACQVDSWDNIGRVTQCHPRFLYCIAVDGQSRVKDLAAKYDRTWATTSRRQRMPQSGLEAVLASYRRSCGTEEDAVEDSCIKTRLIDQGVPSTLADLKGHPIFVLKSHLLKYEILHPPDVAPFAMFRKEPVYLRDNVKLAHTKETWLKEALVVKVGETPCKRVKTLSSRRKHSEKGTDPYVDLFGPWQVENFIPPVAQNGLVPRNQYGNVDLFKKSMLPRGCVHIHLTDVDKVACKLQIDCAPAMVGWAFAKRNVSRPIYDGWVVCREHVGVLKSACAEFYAEKEKKLAQQREKVVIKRWEVLTRRILLRQRLRLEYKF